MRPAVYALIAVTVLDRALTLSAFEHEANPVVAALGPVAWLGVTGLLLGTAVWAWDHYGLDDSRVARGCVWAVTVLTGVAVVANVIVLTA